MRGGTITVVPLIQLQQIHDSQFLLGKRIYIINRYGKGRSRIEWVQRITQMVEEHGGTLNESIICLEQDILRLREKPRYSFLKPVKEKPLKKEPPPDYVIAAEPYGLFFKATFTDDSVDILTEKWLEDCISQSRLLDYLENKAYYFWLGKRTRDKIDPVDLIDLTDDDIVCSKLRF